MKEMMAVIDRSTLFDQPASSLFLMAGKYGSHSYDADTEELKVAFEVANPLDAHLIYPRIKLESFDKKSHSRPWHMEITMKPADAKEFIESIKPKQIWLGGKLLGGNNDYPSEYAWYDKKVRVAFVIDFFKAPLGLYRDSSFVWPATYPFSENEDVYDIYPYCHEILIYEHDTGEIIARRPWEPN